MSGKVTHADVGSSLAKSEWESQSVHLIGGTADLTALTDIVDDTTPTLGGALDAAGNLLNNVGEVYGQVAYGALYINGSPFGSSGTPINFRTTGAAAGYAATVRLSISADAATAVATWSNVTHTGIVLSGAITSNITDPFARDVNSSYLNIWGGQAEAGGMLQLRGEDGSPASAVSIYTRNAAKALNIERLRISGAIDTAIATWANVTHTGLVLSGTLDCNSQLITNAGNITINNGSAYYGKDSGGTGRAMVYITPDNTVRFMNDAQGSLILATDNASGSGNYTSRLTITGNIATAVGTWSNITHTGLVLSGSLDMNNQLLTNSNHITLNNNQYVRWEDTPGGTARNGIGYDTNNDLILANDADGDILLLTDNASGPGNAVTRLTLKGGVDAALASWQDTIHRFFAFAPGSTPASPVEGEVYYDSTANKLKVYNGTTWETISSS